MEDTIDIRDFFFFFFLNPRYGRHGGLVVGILDSYPQNPQKWLTCYFSFWFQYVIAQKSSENTQAYQLEGVHL